MPIAEPSETIIVPGGQVVHKDSVIGKAYLQAAAELRAEAHQDRVLAMKKRILAKRSRPWWRRVLPFVISYLPPE